MSGGEMRQAAEQYVAGGYALAAWERKYGKGPRDDGWGLRAADPRIVTDEHNFGVNHALSRTAVLDADDLELTRRVLEAFDVDVDALAAQTMTWCGNPENRMKLAFRCDAGLSVKKLDIKRGGKNHTVFELRGAPAGNQAQDVLPPSLHPDTKAPYEFITGFRPRDELPELPSQLLHLWQNWNELAPSMRLLAGCEEERKRAQQAKRRAPQPGGGGHADVIGQFNGKYTAVEIIERNGYKPRGRRWLHPDSTTGAAGVIQFEDGCIFSHGGGALADGTSHDAFDCYRIIECGGDMTRAVREAAELLGIPRSGSKANGSASGATLEQDDDTEPLFIDGSTLRQGAYEQPQPIIENVLLPGATLVHGPAKKGKSWLLLQMATAIDAGAPFLGCASHRRDVLYVGCEDTDARLKSRLERIGAFGHVKFMTRANLKRFAERLQSALGEAPMTSDLAVRQLWLEAGKPAVIVIDTQEVFETTLAIAHGKPGDSVTRRDYLATSSYDATANALRIAVVLVGHWGEIKSIEKACNNPHECLNTTKARLAGVTTSITLGPLPNQQPGESTHEMQLSVRSRDLPGGDQFLWLKQDDLTGLYENCGAVRDVQLKQAQQQLCGVLMDARKAHGADHWSTAAELADELDVSAQAIKQMFGRIRRSAKAKGRAPMYSGFTLESKPNKGYRLA